MDIQLAPHAAEIERQEREAERARLIQHALDYAARKRADQLERILRKPLRVEFHTDLNVIFSKPEALSPKHRALRSDESRQRRPIQSNPEEKSDARHGGLQAKTFTVDGNTKNLRQWASYLGIHPTAIGKHARRHRLSVEEALAFRLAHQGHPGGG